MHLAQQRPCAAACSTRAADVVRHAHVHVRQPLQQQELRQPRVQRSCTAGSRHSARVSCRCGLPPRRSCMQFRHRSSSGVELCLNSRAQPYASCSLPQHRAVVCMLPDEVTMFMQTPAVAHTCRTFAPWQLWRRVSPRRRRQQQAVMWCWRSRIWRRVTLCTMVAVAVSVMAATSGVQDRRVLFQQAPRCPAAWQRLLLQRSPHMAQLALPSTGLY
jgi:hypothetical protein